MSNIEIKNCIFKVHPVYDLYAADEAGNVVNIVKKDCIGHKNKNNGYMMCIVRKHAQKGQKTYCVHRFTWECFNGLISDGKVIDHINNIRDDNRLCNLQLVTSSENNKKSSRNRYYTFVKDNHRNKKYVKATNSSTNEVSYYNSLYAVQQHLQINAGIVKMVCEGINNCKTGISKKDNCHYKFEYVKKDDMSDNFKKSANKRSNRVPDEDKKKHKKEAMKNGNKKNTNAQDVVKLIKTIISLFTTKYVNR